MDQNQNLSQQYLLDRSSPQSGTVSTWTRTRHHIRQFQTSKLGHYAVLLLVALDVASIFAVIFITLHICDWKDVPENWEMALEGLEIMGLVFASLFALELVLSILAFGFAYFKSKFRIFDGIVIIVALCFEIFLRGTDQEIASIVVLLRLWRFFKIIEELTAGAEETMEQLRTKVEELELENAEQKAKLARLSGGNLV